MQETIQVGVGVSELEFFAQTGTGSINTFGLLVGDRTYFFGGHIQPKKSTQPLIVWCEVGKFLDELVVKIIVQILETYLEFFPCCSFQVGLESSDDRTQFPGP